jgi:hypothetical protein
MWDVAARAAVISVITGGGQWVEIKTHADPLYQHLILTAERKILVQRLALYPSLRLPLSQPYPWAAAVLVR